jgi:hypothetical protein
MEVAAGREPRRWRAVRFEGRALKDSGVELGEGIGNCNKRFAASVGRGALDIVMTSGGRLCCQPSTGRERLSLR